MYWHFTSSEHSKTNNPDVNTNNIGITATLYRKSDFKMTWNVFRSTLNTKGRSMDHGITGLWCDLRIKLHQRNEYIEKHIITLRKPCSKMKPKIIGTAVKIPIWRRNCVFRAAVSAVFLVTEATFCKDSPTPDNAWNKNMCQSMWRRLRMITWSSTQSHTHTHTQKKAQG